MPTIRNFLVSLENIGSNGWDSTDGGDTPDWLFSEGAWIFDWDGYYLLTGALGSFINVGGSGDSSIIFETGSTDPEDPPPLISALTIQALIDGGAVISNVTGGIGGSAPGDGRITVDSPTLEDTLVSALNSFWGVTYTSGAIFPELTVGTSSIGFILTIPDAPQLEIVGSGGVGISGGVDGTNYLETSGFPVNSLIIIGDGGIIINSGANLVLSADVSGLYTLVANKTNDTLYNRTAGGAETSLVVKIPDPFIRSGFVGN